MAWGVIIGLMLGSGRMAYAQESNTIDLLRSKQKTDYVWVAAHRADCLYAPENSLEAVRHALYFGADIIETDVRMTKDGQIVIMHDYTVDRMTDGTGTISEMTSVCRWYCSSCSFSGEGTQRMQATHRHRRNQRKGSS